METKVKNFLEGSNVLFKPKNKHSLEKNKSFSATLKAHEKDNNKEKDYRAKDKNLKRSNEKTINNSKVNDKEELEKDIEKSKNHEKNTKYIDKYNLVFNLIQNLSNEEKDEKSSLESIDIKTLEENLVSSVKSDEIELEDKSIVENEFLLETDKVLMKKNSEDKELLKSDSINETVSNEDANNKEIEGKNISNLNTLDTDKSLVEDEKQILSNEKINLLETKELLNEENDDNLDNKHGSKSEPMKEGSENKVDSKELNVNDKSQFVLEKPEIKIPTVENVETKESEPINKKQVMEHIVNKVKFDLNSNKNQIKMTLKPESLGEMVMEVEVVKNSLVAKIMVDNQRAKEIIENNLFQLKEGIKDTALEIKTFEVFVGNNSDFNKHDSNQFNFNKRSKKIKIKAEKENKNVGVYEDNIKIDRTNPLNLNSESSLNLFA